MNLPPACSVFAPRRALGKPDRRPPRLVPAASCLLPVACCLLPVACCLLPVACCLLPVACCASRSSTACHARHIRQHNPGQSKRSRQGHATPAQSIDHAADRPQRASRPHGAVAPRHELATTRRADPHAEGRCLSPRAPEIRRDAAMRTALGTPENARIIRCPAARLKLGAILSPGPHASTPPRVEFRDAPAVPFATLAGSLPLATRGHRLLASLAVSRLPPRLGYPVPLLR